MIAVLSSDLTSQDASGEARSVMASSWFVSWFVSRAGCFGERTVRASLKQLSASPVCNNVFHILPHSSRSWEHAPGLSGGMSSSSSEVFPTLPWIHRKVSHALRQFRVCMLCKASRSRFCRESSVKTVILERELKLQDPGILFREKIFGMMLSFD